MQLLATSWNKVKCLKSLFDFRNSSFSHNHIILYIAYSESQDFKHRCQVIDVNKYPFYPKKSEFSLRVGCVLSLFFFMYRIDRNGIFNDIFDWINVLVCFAVEIVPIVKFWRNFVKPFANLCKLEEITRLLSARRPPERPGIMKHIFNDRTFFQNSKISPTRWTSYSLIMAQAQFSFEMNSAIYWQII